MQLRERAATMMQRGESGVQLGVLPIQLGGCDSESARRNWATAYRGGHGGGAICVRLEP